jgi:phage shock protein PspC (stress-responsive transcriptional regulator)
MVTAGPTAATGIAVRGGFDIMQEQPTGSERPGEQRPAAGAPTPPSPPPPRTEQGPPPEGTPPSPPPPGGQPPPSVGPGAGGQPPPSVGPGAGGPGGYPGYQAPGQPYPPPGGGYPPAAPRRLTRRTDDRVLGGVASGLGTYFGVDPVVFRIGFVALTLVGGTGLLIYLLLWAVLPAVDHGGPGAPPPPAAGGPRQGEPPILAALRQGGAKSYLAVGAMILAVLLLVGPFARPPVVFALLLIGVGVLLMVQDRPDQATGSAAPWPPDRPTPPPGGGQQPGDQWEQRRGWQQPPEPPQGGQGPSGDPSRAAYATATQPGARDDVLPGWDSPTGRSHGGARDWGTAGSPTVPSGWGPGDPPSAWGSTATGVAERQRQRPRSALGWLTVAAALLAAGVASALDNLGVVHMTPTRVLALVLTVVGVGLLVGSRWGRAWWLILVGLLLVPVMGAASLVKDVPVRGETGQQVVRPQTLADVRPEYRLSAGELTINLRQVAFGPGAHRISASVGAGNLNVILPDDQPVTIHSRIGAGEMQLLGHPSNGFQIEDTVSEPGGPRLGLLTLDLRAGVGQIVVSRGP